MGLVKGRSAGEGVIERRILIGMVTDKTVLGRLVSRWTDEGLFASEESNRIGGWAVEHYRKFADAPNRGIEDYLREWARGQADGAKCELTENLLRSIDDEYIRDGEEPRRNPEQVINAAGKHFDRVAVIKIQTQLGIDVEANKIDQAVERIGKFHRIELGLGKAVPLLTDEEAVRSTFAQESVDDLFAYPNALGNFFRHSLRREGFLSFCGPQKTGKTHWLVDLTWRALQNRCKVAFFMVGDLNEQETKELIIVRGLRRPVLSPDGKWPMTIKWPTKVWLDGDDPAVPHVNFDDRTFDVPLNGDTAWKLLQGLMTRKLKTNVSPLWISCHPNLSISVNGIKSELEGLERLHDFLPEVCVIDYADNLSPVDKREEPRDRINMTWKLLRALAMERHCLVVTATQCNAAGFKKRWLDRTNFSEDNRKLSHVTGMIGINLDPEEKLKQLCRLNWIVKRRGAYSWTTGPTVATCMALGHPAVESCW